MPSPNPFPTHRPGGSGDAPVGSVLAYAGALSAPGQSSPAAPLEAQGWMLCDGRTLQVAQYPELFAVLGHVYGGSDGQFCIPDYRGDFPRGGELAPAGVEAVPPSETRPASVCVRYIIKFTHGFGR